MRRMIISVLPWTLFVLMIVAWVPGLIFDRSSLEVTTTFDKIWAISFLAFPMVGLFLTRRLPANPVGWLFLIGPALVGAGVSLSEYAESTARNFGHLSDLVFETGLIAMFASILLFPDGRYPNRWFKWAHLAGIAGFVVMSLMDADLGIVIACNFLLPVGALVVRFARGGPLVRRQIAGPVAIVVLGLFLMGASEVVGTWGGDDRWGTVVGAFASLVLTIGVPVTIAIAILKYRLYEIDRIISRTVGYVIVIVFLGAVYMGGLATLTFFLPSDSPLAVAGSTLAAAAMFSPVRRRVQGWVDRRFNRSRYDTQKVMEEFSGSLRDEVDPGQVVAGWVGVVSATMQPVSAAVWVRGRDTTVFKAAVAVWSLLMVVVAVSSVSFAGEIDSIVGVLIASVCSVVVGAILTVKVPSNSVGLLSLLAGSAWVLYSFGRGYATLSLASAEPLPWAYFFGWLGSWTGALFLIGVSLLILCFPTGKPVGWWRVVGLGPVAGAASTVIGAFLLWGLPLETLVDDALVSTTRWYPLVDAGFIIGFVSVIPATFSVVARFRGAGSVERQQVKWLMAATTLLAIAYLVGALSDDSNEAVWWVVSLAVAAIPIAILFAVLRYRLYDIDRILSRTVSYVIVIGVLGAVYALGLTALTAVLDAESPLAVAGSTLAAAALFTPLRRRVQAGVERRFNRSRYDAQQVMDEFSGSLRQDLDPDTVVRGWVGVVSETMHPTSISVWVRNDFGTMGR